MARQKVAWGLVIVVAACGGPPKRRNCPPRVPTAVQVDVVVGSPAPPFTRRSLDGATVSVPTKRPATVLFFWATWSSPDMRLLAAVQRIATSHPEIAVLAVSVDDEPRSVLEVARRQGATYPVLWDEGHRITDAYRPRSEPTTLVVDRDNVVRFVHPGFHEGDEYAIDDEIASLLGKEVCARKPMTDYGPACFYHCDRVDQEAASCTAPGCKDRCSVAARDCRTSCARDNRGRNQALAICKRERPAAREACIASCHTDEMGYAIDTCRFQSAERPVLVAECAATCSIEACYAACRGKR